MLKEVELYVYNRYIKGMIVEENGVKKISKEELEKLELSPHEKNFIMYIINKQKIKVVEGKITKTDRSPYVRDNNYRDIQTHGLQKMDEPAMSKIEYSETGDQVIADYKELDEYLETRFIPTYVLLKQRKNDNNEIEYFPSIRLKHIMALKLSEAELEHVMNYLKEKNIRVGGKAATLDSEFENYDYITTYKGSALPPSVSSTVTLQKIRLYKQNGDKKLREEIITDSMRLVPYVAYRYAMSTGIDQHELESYGYEGLILALEKFDVNYGCAFSTYAVACIRGYILRGIREMQDTKKDTFYNDYINAKNAVEKESGVTLLEAPELVEDVIELLVATGKIKDNAYVKKYVRSRIEAVVFGNKSLDDLETFEELTDSGYLVDSNDYSEEVLRTITKEELEKRLDSLTAREAEIIRLRFGFYDGSERTLEEVGQIYGLPRERIRQIEARALRKLRHPSRSRHLDDFLDIETQKYGKSR